MGPVFVYNSAAFSDDACLCPARTTCNILCSHQVTNEAILLYMSLPCFKVMLILGDMVVFCHMGSCTLVLTNCMFSAHNTYTCSGHSVKQRGPPTPYDPNVHQYVMVACRDVQDD